jgi:hypothetical protein
MPKQKIQNTKPAKIRPVNGVTGVIQFESPKLAFTMPSRSYIEMIVTREVSLNMPMKVFTIPGITSLMACGSTTKVILWK